MVGCSSESAMGPSGGGADASPKPTIATFEVTPATLPYGGGTVTARWTVADASSLELQGAPVTGSSAELAVTTSTTVELRARGPGGEATARADVTVETTVTIDGRVTDEQGNPLANILVELVGSGVGFTTNDDGKFPPIAGVVAPYSICLSAPDTCFIGLTRPDPTLAVSRTTPPPPPIASSIAGAASRADAAPMVSSQLRTAVDGTGDSTFAANAAGGQGASLPYTTTLRTIPGVAPVGRVWALWRDGANAAFGQTLELALVAGGTTTNHDVVLAPIPTVPVQVVQTSAFPNVGYAWGLVSPRGALLRLDASTTGALTVPVVPGAKLFVSASAFDGTTVTPLSTSTTVAPIASGPFDVTIPQPVVPMPIGVPITPTTQITWAAVAGATYRVTIIGSRRHELVTTTPSMMYPFLPARYGTDCAMRSCTISIAVYGGLPTVDAATERQALGEVRRGARAGSFTPGPTIQFAPGP